MTETEIVTQTDAPRLAQPVNNPFERVRADHLAAGTVEIESSRAIAEAQGKLVIAKKFPRDNFAAFQRIIDACSRPGLAGEAFYAYQRGGQTVTGPSIRLAEELARCWGNIDYGIRELSQREGESEMEAYAWDLETNTVTTQKFTVKHIRDTKSGSKGLTEQRDIYEIGANMGARRLRARILALLPKDIVDAAETQCRATIAGKSNEPVSERVRKMVAAFSTYGVSPEMIERRLGKPLKDILPDDLADLQGIYVSLKDGVSRAGDWFNSAALIAPNEPSAPAAPAQTAAPSPVKVPEPASTGRGRPSKAETDAAESAGRKARRQGAPRETAPADLKPSLKAAWEAGWDAEPEAAPVDPADGAPFDMPEHDPETGEVIDAPKLAEATGSAAGSAGDDFGFGE